MSNDKFEAAGYDPELRQTITGETIREIPDLTGDDLYYAPPVSAKQHVNADEKHQPNFTYDEPSQDRPIAHRASKKVAKERAKARRARDGAQYTRQQKGHSLILNLLIVGPLTLFITTIYWSVSPNHYWHA